ncbi:hypothetical protein BC834DRAFT_440785 [Gloeopeniophorella convolvens]|nr:hypothetical protein BC834DRAFT_440785 [Gloeopeniophorella convolvens]
MVDQLQSQPKTAKKPVRFDVPGPSSTPETVKTKNERPASTSQPSTRFDPGPSENRVASTSRSPRTARTSKNRASSRRVDLPLPPPPEKEPTPPTKVVKSPRGHLFTVDDKKYFAKFISWQLHIDPSLTKSELIEMLGEKVPHHSAMSWRRYWCRDPLADRLMKAAQGEMDSEERDERLGDGVSEEEEVDEEDDDPDDTTSTDSGEEEDGTIAGVAGSSFRSNEIKEMARHIAKHDAEQWATMSHKQRWYPYHEEHPGRTDRAYTEKYRHIEPKLLRMAERYRRRERRALELETQRGRPSWAGGGRKRRVSAHDGSEKRVRMR